MKNDKFKMVSTILDFTDLSLKLVPTQVPIPDVEVGALNPLYPDAYSPAPPAIGKVGPPDICP